MKTWTIRAARRLSVLAVAGGMALAAAAPASAAPRNAGIGLQATGIISSIPIGISTFPGISPVDAPGIHLPLFSTGALYTDTGPTGANAMVSGVSVGLPDIISLSTGTVASTCSYNPATGTVVGGAAIADGVIRLLDKQVVIAPSPAPNTTFTLRNVGTVVVNRQTIAPNGRLTVDALSFRLRGNLENVVVARTVCNQASRL